MTAHQVEADAIQKRRDGARQCRGPDARARGPAARQNRDAHESGYQADEPPRADPLTVEQEGDQGGEHHRHRVADGADARRRPLGAPGEQRKRNDGVDGGDAGDAQPQREAELRASGP